LGLEKSTGNCSLPRQEKKGTITPSQRERGPSSCATHKKSERSAARNKGTAMSHPSSDLKEKKKARCMLSRKKRKREDRGLFLMVEQHQATPGESRRRRKGIAASIG